MYENSTKARQSGVMDRLSSVEQDVRQHDEIIKQHHEKHLRDLRYLAEVLGVTLPSDEPRPALEPVSEYRGGLRG